MNKEEYCCCDGGWINAGCKVHGVKSTFGEGGAIGFEDYHVDSDKEPDKKTTKDRNASPDVIIRGIYEQMDKRELYLKRHKRATRNFPFYKEVKSV